ncbi:DUF4174 domain-containing protein [Paracoccus suum]|uniref:DUF4174 domain-containing protein n=1 Tax=Paracoccus suum TaxID=2259340 RepID=A0A344PG11_9RHOB|nr:DUF4174 domain-containing protein [Paracoccus suum]AXC48316.1 DUF4174 domain-containing protein [Paracoccus suum]
MKFKMMMLAAVPLLMAMGDGRPGPVALPQGAEVPGAGLNRAGTRDAPAPGSVATPTAQDELRILEAKDAQPAEFLWQSRVVVVFADTAADPAFTRQITALQSQPASLMARDVVVVTDVDPAGGSVWRKMLRPEGFSLVVIDKDGQVKTRKPLPWTVREIARAIDKFPSRLEEIGRAGLGL